MERKIVSGIMLTLLLVGMLILTFNIQRVKSDWTWTETIYIRADGSVEPDTAPISSVDNITYTFTDNIYDEIVVERDNIVVEGASCKVQGTGNGIGVDLSYRNNVTLKNVEVTNLDGGIHLYSSGNNTITGNTVSNNKIGISLSSSSNNVLTGNNASSNNWDGIYLYHSSNNTLTGNTASNNWEGIYLSSSSNNNVLAGNTVSSNKDYGIDLFSSSQNMIIDNVISENALGICLKYSGENTIYHNDFVNNAEQASIVNFVNVWDNGVEGNYWSDYTGKDQNGDGIGDTPYIIGGLGDTDIDNYPLMSPWTLEEEEGEEVPFWMQWWFYAIVAVAITALAGGVYFLKKRKPPTAPTPPTPPTEGTLEKTTQNTNPLNSYLTLPMFPS